MTPEEFRRTDTYAIVNALKATGNQPGIIARCKADMERWANAPAQRNMVDAAAVRAWLPHWQVRPFYTAAELAPLWPMLAIVVGARTRLPSVPKSAARISYELRWARLPVVGTIVDDLTPQGRTYYAVERLHHYAKVAITRAELLREIERA